MWPLHFLERVYTAMLFQWFPDEDDAVFCSWLLILWLMAGVRLARDGYRALFPFPWFLRDQSSLTHRWLIWLAFQSPRTLAQDTVSPKFQKWDVQVGPATWARWISIVFLCFFTSFCLKLVYFISIPYANTTRAPSDMLEIRTEVRKDGCPVPPILKVHPNAKQRIRNTITSYFKYFS